MTPITLVFLLVLANRRSLLGAAANGRLARSVGLVTVVVIGAFAAAAVGITLAGRFGLAPVSRVQPLTRVYANLGPTIVCNGR